METKIGGYDSESRGFGRVEDEVAARADGITDYDEGPAHIGDPHDPYETRRYLLSTEDLSPGNSGDPRQHGIEEGGWA